MYWVAPRWQCGLGPKVVNPMAATQVESNKETDV